MPLQKFNDQNSELLATVFQRRYEPNFSMAQAAGVLSLLPEVRAVWPFAAIEGAGVADVSGNGRLLAIQGMTTGVYGLMQYGSFDGANDYCTRPDEDGIRITGALSLGGWFYFGAGAAVQGMIGKWVEAGNQRHYRLYRNASNQIVAEISSDGTVTFTATSAAVANDTWVFCGLRYTPSTTLSVLVNDTWVDNSTSIPAATFGSTVNLDVGRPNASNYLTGRALLCFLAADDLPKAEFGVIYQATRALFKV